MQMGSLSTITTIVSRKYRLPGRQTCFYVVLKFVKGRGIDGRTYVREKGFLTR